MKKLLILPFMAAAVMMASCNGKNTENTYSSNAICTFEYTDADDMAGDDKIYFDQSFIGGGVFSFNNKVSADKSTFFGGCALVGLADPLLEEGHVAKDLCVYGTGYNKSTYYITVKYNPGSMPEHLAHFYQAGSGTLNLGKCYINNTNQMVTIAHYGLAAHDGKEAIPAFAEGDYLTVQFIGQSLSGNMKNVEVTLAKYENGTLQVCDEWKEVDLSPLGAIDYLDVLMSTNRHDLPLCFCIDNLSLSAEFRM